MKVGISSNIIQTFIPGLISDNIPPSHRSPESAINIGPSTKPSIFTEFAQLNEIKSYIAITGCVMEHILSSTDLSYTEKLFYITADSLSLINHNEGKQRAVALPSDKWASTLKCSKSQIFKLQQSLTDKGYFIILKEKNKHGQNKRNFIIPTLPDQAFGSLAKLPDRVGGHLPYNPLQECKRGYLDRTKLFIKLNYQLLKIITSDRYLAPFHKIIWLDFYTSGYKSNMVSDKKHGGFGFTVSYQELTAKYSCSMPTLSKAMNILEELEFIKREHLYIRKEHKQQDRQDKSLWKITLSLRIDHGETLSGLANRSSISSELPQGGERAKINGDISSCDPEVSNFIPYINKDFKINKIIKNIDSLDSESEIFKKSAFCKNAFGGKGLKDWYPLTKEQTYELNSRAKREFSVNFTNELLLKLGTKYPNRTFANQNQLMSYMTKALLHEKHQGPKVNHETFRFAKDDEESKKLRTREKYLAEIEYNLDTSCLSQLRRKIAALFDTDIAYNLLTSCKFTMLQDDVFKVEYAANLKLINRQKQVLANEIKSVYGEVEIVYTQLESRVVGNCTFSHREEEISFEELGQKSAWYKIRRELRNYLGVSIDKAWLSKLKPEEDKESGKILLKAPTNFIKDWINSKYGTMIRECCASVNLQFDRVLIDS